MNIGYFINGDYIIEIDIIDDYNKSHNNMINQTYAEYYTEKYKILSITNWKTGLQKNKIKNYKINDIKYKKIAFVKNKDIAIQNIFKDIDKKNKNEEDEYLKTKTGIFINYYKNGQIYKNNLETQNNTFINKKQPFLQTKQGQTEKWQVIKQSPETQQVFEKMNNSGQTNDNSYIYNKYFK